MKKCPFCAEEIQSEAIKCRYCGEFLDSSYRPHSQTNFTNQAYEPHSQTKWYYKSTAIWSAFLIVGPFVLPLIWKNPKYTLLTKTISTIFIIIITLALCYLMGYLYKYLINSFNEQMNVLGIQ